MTTAYTKRGAETFNNNDAQVFEWNLTDGETGDPVVLPAYADRSVHVLGNLLGASVTLQGSNELDETALTSTPTLTDPQGNAITFTVPGIKAVSEMTRVVRPKVTGGTGSAIKILLFAKR